jgi:integrative and conjugative element protein (TIGR02256 family)
MRARDFDGVAAGRLWLSDDALLAMVEEAESAEPNETGGVLLGWTAGDQRDIVARRAIGPGPRAKHRPTRFSPDTRWQRVEIAEEYERSGRILTYIGDWHSHPGGSERPSTRDWRTARRIARSRGARATKPVILILRGAKGDWVPVPYRLLDNALKRMDWAVTDSTG